MRKQNAKENTGIASLSTGELESLDLLRALGPQCGFQWLLKAFNRAPLRASLYEFSGGF